MKIKEDLPQPDVFCEELLENLDGVEEKEGYHTALCPLHAEPVKMVIHRCSNGQPSLRCSGGCRRDDILVHLFPERENLIRPSMAIIRAMSPFNRPNPEDVIRVFEEAAEYERLYLGGREG